MRVLFVLGALLAAIVTVAPAMAQEKEIATLKAVLAVGPLDPALLSAEFLKAVPAAQLEPVVSSIKATIGPVVARTADAGGVK